MKFIRTAWFGALLLAPALVLAQWQWLDKDGRKVFSDQPPPNDVPAAKILKQPAGRPAAAPGAESPVASAAPASKAASAPAAPKLSGKDKELEEKKKKAEQEEAAKQKAEEEKAAAARAKNCEKAKQALTALNSGERIRRANSKGEMEFMGDKERASETQRVQEIVSNECKA
ncbi:MAG: DUF4124 domain-containing protein [Ramlibacter sp.]|nr:DUF4124 domain-containing protein [Ramlibacter sp.]